MNLITRLFAWNPPPPNRLRVREDGCLDLTGCEVLCDPQLPTGYESEPRTVLGGEPPRLAPSVAQQALDDAVSDLLRNGTGAVHVARWPGLSS